MALVAGAPRSGGCCAAGEISLLLIGWGLAKEPYLAYPGLKLVDVAAPPGTIRFLLASLPAGAILLIPALWCLFSVFKRKRVQQ